MGRRGYLGETKQGAVGLAWIEERSWYGFGAFTMVIRG